MKSRLSLFLSILIFCASFSPAFSFQEQPFYYENFIVPAETFSHNHSSSMVELKNGDVLMTWTAGIKERDKTVQIYAVEFSPSDHSYSKPRVVVQSGERPKGPLTFKKDKTLGNSVLYMDDEGVVWVFYTSIVIGGWSGSVVSYKVSHNQGRTWSESKRLIPFLGNLVRNRPLKLDASTFLLPMYSELFTYKGYVCRIAHKSGKILAKDSRSAVPADGFIQPSLAWVGEDKILMLLRDRSKKNIRRTFSYDKGKTWGPVDSLELPNPNSPVDLLRMDDGRLLLIYNDSQSSRTPLSIAVSSDKGMTFRKIKDLETGPGTFAYPSILKTKDSMIHVIYTYNYKTIRHLVFNEAWLEA